MLKWIKPFFRPRRQLTEATHTVCIKAETESSFNIKEASLQQKSEGDAFLDRGDWVHAAESYKRAIAYAPDFSDAYNNLGFVLAERGHYAAAVRRLEQTITLNQVSFQSYYILGTIAHRLNKLDDAIAHFRGAIEASPGFAEGLDYLGQLLREQGNVKSAIECYRRALAINPHQHVTHSNLLLTLQYDHTQLQADRYAEHRKFAERFEAPLIPYRRPHSNEGNIGRRLKIGYVSPDFRRHSVALFIMPVLANHNKDQFEIFCYYNNASGDEYTSEFVKMADHFVPCFAMSDDDLSERIRADGIDILVDLAGHTAHNRLLVFACKPAPVQVSYLGYIDTTGLTGIDYRLTSVDADPPENDHYYSEELYRFTKHLWWVFQAAPLPPATLASPALKNGFITFISNNQIAKISSPMIDVWAKILHAVPNSRMILMGIPEGRATHSISEKFACNGIDRLRLDFHSFLPLDEYRGVLLQSDICLDTFPFNGGTTTCETLSLGLPVVTMKGESFASRMGYALLKEIGMEKLVAASRAEYVKIAVELACNFENLSALRSEMRDRIAASTLLKADRFTGSLEAAYRDMWLNYVRKNN